MAPWRAVSPNTICTDMTHTTHARSFFPVLASGILSLLILLVATHPSAAQQVPEPDPADVESVDAIMAAVYDVISGPAGQARDWDRMRSLFHPDARLIPSGRNPDTGQGGIRYLTIEDYISGPGQQLESMGFFETEIHRVEERYADIAHIFSTYESRRNADDAEPFMRGINSFQLRFDGTRWWVINIFWQGESPHFPIPDTYLGG